MIFYFAVGPDAVYNDILTEQNVDARLISFFFLKKFDDETFEKFIEEGRLPKGKKKRRKLK